MSFGSQPLGLFTPAQSLTVTNTGHGNLQIDAARLASGDGDDFLISTDTCSHNTLAAGATCTLSVRFGPSGLGDRAATLTLTSNDPSGPLQIALHGIGAELPVARGDKGDPGDKGDKGDPGPQGPKGDPGQVLLVTCTAGAGRHHDGDGHRQRCTTEVIAGPATFTAIRGARASLTRNHVLYATGTASGGRAVLRVRRPLRHGRYALTVRTFKHGHRVTTRTPITIR